MEIDLNNSLGFRINKVANQLNTKFNHILQKYDIAIEQRVTLEIIKKENDVTLTKVSNILQKDKTTMSRTISTLSKKGYINRTIKKDDKRVTILSLTRKGEETLAKSKVDVNNFRTLLLKKLNENEVKELFNLLDKININQELL